jgi:tyrosine-protein kinase Etk/Wzc
MNIQQAQITAFAFSDPKNKNGKGSSSIQRYLYHWPLFVIGMAITGTLFFFYLKTDKPVYEVKASLLIQDEKKTPNQQAPLQEINLLNSTRIIENEFEILKSKQLIGQVISDLQLAVQYRKKDSFGYTDLYKDSPVKLTVPGAPDAAKYGKFNIVINSPNTFIIKYPNDREQEVAFNSEVKDEYGTWKLEAVKDLTSYINSEIEIANLDPDFLAIDYQKRIDVTLSNKLSTTIVLSLHDQVPQRGKDVLNTLINNYNQVRTVSKNQEIKNTIDFLDQRLNSLRVELNDAERGIETFKSSRGLTDMTSDSKISLENMQANDARLNDVNIKLSVISGVEKYIRSAQGPDKVPTTLGIDDPALSSQIEKLALLQLQREKLLATTPETNPDFEPINRQISTTKTAIKENVENIRTSLVNTRDKLQTYNRKFESSIKNIPTQERQYVNIKRQQSIKESLYNYLLQKREEVSIRYASSLEEDRVVDRAYAGAPSGTMKSLAAALALIFGFGLPFGIVYMRIHFTSKIEDVSEITDAVKIPVIGELLLETGKKKVPANSNWTTAISEQIRAIRIRLQHIYSDKRKGRVILITSSVAGEGKSFLSSNLALATAFAGRKTVLVELDLRKPKILKNFKMDSSLPGVSDYLAGETSVDKIIQNSNADAYLDIIGSGTALPNPSQILENGELQQLIQDLANVYDDIIIDSPPVHLISDALLFAKMADLTLYVMRQGVTSKSELAFIKDLQSQNHLPNLNIVFNGVQSRKYGYGYSYDMNYYDQKPGILSPVFSNFADRF